MKVGMDSTTASYFALFEVINHSFGMAALLCFTQLLPFILQRGSSDQGVPVPVTPPQC